MNHLSAHPKRNIEFNYIEHWKKNLFINGICFSILSEQQYVNPPRKNN